jgi:hypothetical protein
MYYNVKTSISEKFCQVNVVGVHVMKPARNRTEAGLAGPGMRNRNNGNR